MQLLLRFLENDPLTRGVKIVQAELAPEKLSRFNGCILQFVLNKIQSQPECCPSPAETAAQVAALLESGAALSRNQNPDCQKKPEAENWIFFSRRPPNGRSIAPVSSRLSKDMSRWTFWFDALRTLMCKLDAEKHLLISAERTTTHRYVAHLANLFGLPRLHYEHWPKGKSLNDLANYELDREFVWPAFVIGTGATRQPLDEIVIAAADEVRVLFIREGGNVNRAIQSRLAGNCGGQVYVAMEKSTSETQQLLDQGAIGWLLFGAATQNDKRASNVGPRWQSKIIQLAEVNESEFLHHFTRPRAGSWPDQSESNYFDELLFGDSTGNHDILATLMRIVVMKRILASSKTTRSKHKVCSFTQVPLSDFDSLRRFRPHLSRWDFLPFGISIRKKILEDLGARPVIYGDEDKWQSLAVADQPFFHPNLTVSKTGNENVWSVEREWRLLSDVDFSQLDTRDCFVFVADEQSAQAIATATHFPVVLTPAKTS